jgi:hypothetical protein
MLVLRAIVDEEEYPGQRNACHEVVQKCLALRVEPMEILDNNDQGLNLALVD